MIFDYERIPILLEFVSDEDLFSLYNPSNKRDRTINKMGIRSSRIEEIKKNREKLIKNLLIPVNKKTFETWLFKQFTELKKNRDEDSNNNNDEKKTKFSKLLFLLLENNYEEFDALVKQSKIETLQSENKINEPMSQKIIEQEDSKKLRRLNDKITKLQDDLKAKDNQCLERIQPYKDKIINLRDYNKKLQDELQKSKQKCSEFEKILEIKCKENSNLNSEKEVMLNEIENLKNRVTELLKKEIWVLGNFDISRVKNKNIHFKLFTIEELESVKSIENEFWIIAYTLSPRELYFADQLSSSKSINNKKNTFKNYKELLEKIRELNIEVEK